jgi:hypothetical protein
MERARRRWLKLATGLILASATGCGTVLHPERRGQPAGRIDWAVFALDAVGLIFFFIPGVVAFAVDFATGAIYLPADPYVTGVPLTKNLRRVDAPHARPSVAEVEAIVSQQVGQTVELSPRSCFAEKLERLEDFALFHERLAKPRASEA